MQMLQELQRPPAAWRQLLKHRCTEIESRQLDLSCKPLAVLTRRAVLREQQEDTSKTAALPGRALVHLATWQACQYQPDHVRLLVTIHKKSDASQTGLPT
jgi:hypothetical protein